MNTKFFILVFITFAAFLAIINAAPIGEKRSMGNGGTNCCKPPQGPGKRGGPGADPSTNDPNDPHHGKRGGPGADPGTNDPNNPHNPVKRGGPGADPGTNDPNNPHHGKRSGAGASGTSNDPNNPHQP